jgi:hypothetical protein
VDGTDVHPRRVTPRVPPRIRIFGSRSRQQAFGVLVEAYAPGILLAGKQSYIPLGWTCYTEVALLQGLFIIACDGVISHWSRRTFVLVAYPVVFR